MLKMNYVKSLNFSYDYAELLKKIIKETSYETYLHSQRLKEPAFQLGKYLNLNKQQLAEVVLLAELHDLGKIVIDNNILAKKGPLNNEEWARVKEHSQIGFQLAYNSLEIINVAQGILTHHEWWNGEGYPFGIGGESIPLIARIIAIVDAYDVMKYGRNYQQAMSKEKIIEELINSAGSQFDPELIGLFIELIL